MRKLKRFWGIVCAIATIIYSILWFMEQYHPVFLVLTAVFGLLSFVLLRKGKPKEAAAEASELAQPVDAYISTGNMTFRADKKPIEEREIPYLIGQGLQNATEINRSPANPKWLRSERDQELETNFMMRHGSLSDKKAAAFESLEHQARQTKDIDEKIELLKAALLKYYEVKAWHYNKSKGAMLWFQDMWENMHNSHNECFSWDESVKKDLQYWITVRDEIIPKLIQIFSQRPTLQKDIYVHFPEYSKANIRKVVDILAEQGTITKEQKGSTYLIMIS